MDIRILPIINNTVDCHIALQKLRRMYPDGDGLFDFNKNRFMGHVTAFYAYIGPAIVAVACIANYRGHYFLRCCYVDKEYRGKGFQRQLIEYRLRWLCNKKVKKVGVWVRPDNAPSLNNVVACGFKFKRAKMRFFGGHPHCQLEKIIP